MPKESRSPPTAPSTVFKPFALLNFRTFTDSLLSPFYRSTFQAKPPQNPDPSECPPVFLQPAGRNKVAQDACPEQRRRVSPAVTDRFPSPLKPCKGDTKRTVTGLARTSLFSLVRACPPNSPTPDVSHSIPMYIGTTVSERLTSDRQFPSELAIPPRNSHFFFSRRFVQIRGSVHFPNGVPK